MCARVWSRKAVLLPTYIDGSDVNQSSKHVPSRVKFSFLPTAGR
jgi:hypothetical protein